MWDQLSPIMEGFANPTMDSVFHEMLKTTTPSLGTPLTYVQGGEVLTYGDNLQIVLLNDNLFPASPAAVGYIITGDNVQPNTTVVSYRFGKSNPNTRYDVIFLTLSKPVTGININQTFYYSAPPDIPTRVTFLQNLVEQQEDLAHSLMASAKKIGPIGQRKIIKDIADDGAFESDTVAPLPNTSGTLQGFTLVFFILSFLTLAIVFCININYISGNTTYAVYTFICFVVLFIVSMALIIRFG